MESLLLDDAARLLGISREQLEAELAGLDGALSILGHGPRARFGDEAALRKFLDYHSSLSGAPVTEPPEIAALQEILRALAAVDQMKAERDSAAQDARELRRILHKVVLDNVMLTERVNELSVLRMRDRSPSPSGLSWYRRLWNRLLGRSTGAGAGRRARRVA